MSQVPKDALLPQGLKVVLDAFSIAVLKAQPENIMAFSAFYFQELLHFREARPDLGLQDLVKKFNDSKVIKPSHGTMATVAPPGQEVEQRKEETSRKALSCVTETKQQEAAEDSCIHNGESQDKQHNIRQRKRHNLPLTEMPSNSTRTNVERLSNEHLTKNLLGTSSSEHPTSSENEVVVYVRKSNSCSAESGHEDVQDLGTPGLCKRTRSAVFERLPCAEIDAIPNTVVIRTSSVPHEYMIVVHSDNVFETIVFRDDSSASDAVEASQTPLKVDAVAQDPFPALGITQTVMEKKEPEAAGLTKHMEDASLFCSREIQAPLNGELFSNIASLTGPAVDKTLPTPQEQMPNEAGANSVPEVAHGPHVVQVQAAKVTGGTDFLPPSRSDTKPTKEEDEAFKEMEITPQEPTIPTLTDRLASTEENSSSTLENPAVLFEAGANLAVEEIQSPKSIVEGLLHPSKEAYTICAEQSKATESRTSSDTEIVPKLLPPTEMPAMLSVPEPGIANVGFEEPSLRPPQSVSAEVRNPQLSAPQATATPSMLNPTTPAHEGTGSSAPAADAQPVEPVPPCAQPPVSCGCALHEGREYRGPPGGPVPPCGHMSRHSGVCPIHFIPYCSQETISHGMCEGVPAAAAAECPLITAACGSSWRLCHLACPKPVASCATGHMFLPEQLGFPVYRELGLGYYCSDYQRVIPALCPWRGAIAAVPTVPAPRHLDRHCCHPADVTPPHYLLINDPSSNRLAETPVSFPGCPVGFGFAPVTGCCSLSENTSTAHTQSSSQGLRNCKTNGSLNPNPNEDLIHTQTHKSQQ